MVYATGANAEFGRIAAGSGRTPARDRLPGRAAPLLVPAAAGGGGADGARSSSSTCCCAAGDRCGAVLAGDRGRHHAAAAARGGQHQPGDRVAAAGQAKVLVKRLVCIEDLGDIDILFTDKTGTLTEGRISLSTRSTPRVRTATPCCARAAGHRRRSAIGRGRRQPARRGAVGRPAAARTRGRCRTRVGDAAVRPRPPRRRRCWSTTTANALLIVKGAPEQVLARCRRRLPKRRSTRWTRCSPPAAGWSPWPAKPAPELTTITADDEHDLMLAGFLVFPDQPKAAARESLAQLAALGIAVKIVTGDNPLVAEKVCAELGLASKGTLTGADSSARRRRARRRGAEPHDLRPGHPRAEGAADHVGAAHRAVGRLPRRRRQRRAGPARRRRRHLGRLAPPTSPRTPPTWSCWRRTSACWPTGVAEGRRIFANTIKYVLMGTSSNFGNMFSAAAASAFLPFLPMLPSQILLNNLLYDTCQLAIPTDRVDEEQLQRRRTGTSRSSAGSC